MSTETDAKDVRDRPARTRFVAPAFLKDRRGALLLLIVLAMIVMSLSSPYFLQVPNLLTLMQYSAVVGILALGQTMVILGGGGGIDLSIGSIMSACSVVFGILAGEHGVSPWLAALVALVAGAVLGALNGLLITALGLPPLIVTLGTWYLYASAAQVATGGTDVSGFDRDGFTLLGQTSVLGVPFQVLCILVPLGAIMVFLTRRTAYGRNVYAVGSSDVTARLAGVPVDRIRISLYAISGTTAAVGAIVTASWLLNAKSTAGSGLELQAITIAVLGGIAITGGLGRISGVLMALVLVGILSNGLQLADVGSTFQRGLLGAVLVVSMLVRSRAEARRLVT
ncbi:ribose/xylose/arabinose/galactoside ABC-type transport system permease subunit [Nakamurella flavida]|uniref:ABC transporter permease n=1 Tax=Nakamurella flavida TaxID=363630 RepID=UPI0027814144|nr:ABC transporter permease [Nakamurella flavida]MDP9778526.1 ribose/xylose/arabinose/galactoside ABC-type transport system permease subunit [Nakamurella flavida]